LGSAGPLGRDPLRDSCDIGTWMASVLTLKPAVLSSTWPLPTPRRSKMPRST
jgi:hypothetical protein